MNFHNASGRPSEFLDGLLKKVVPPYLDVVEVEGDPTIVELYEKTNREVPVIRWYRTKSTFSLRRDIKNKFDKYVPLKEEEFEFEGQSYLFWEYMRLLNEINPKYFFLIIINSFL